MAKSRFPAGSWRVWAFLTLVPAIGAGLLAPIAVETILAVATLPPGTPPPPPAPIMMLLGGAQAAVILAIAAGIGLRAAHGLDRYPVHLHRWLGGGRTGTSARSAGLLVAAPLGLMAGAAMVVADPLLFGREPTVLAGDLAQRLVGAMLYGGIGEEVLCRLFLVSVLVRGLGLALRKRDGAPSELAWALAIVGAAVAFGLGHLPLANLLGETGPAAIGRILLLNGVGGLVFGYLFKRYGLESAVVAHAAAHLALQILPTFW